MPISCTAVDGPMKGERIEFPTEDQDFAGFWHPNVPKGFDGVVYKRNGLEARFETFVRRAPQTERYSFLLPINPDAPK